MHADMHRTRTLLLTLLFVLLALVLLTRPANPAWNAGPARLHSTITSS